MAITISTGLRDALINAAAGLYDGGVLEIRTGAPPGPNAADGGTLLVSIDLPNPAFGSASGGSASLAGDWTAAAVAAGTAAHFRLKQAGDGGGADATQERIEGTVGATGSGADLELDNTNIAAGQTVTINAFSASIPAGGV